MGAGETKAEHGKLHRFGERVESEMCRLVRVCRSEYWDGSQQMELQGASESSSVQLRTHQHMRVREATEV